jgi:pyruvate, orthophosphate dikinase
MKWCAKATRLQVRTNADTPSRPRNAIAFGATGIGLTRTEHMFFEGDRIDAMREMILADNSRTAKEGAGQAPALPARGLHRHLQGAQGLPGHHPLPRSAAARVPAAHQGAADGPRQEARHPVEKIAQRVHELHEFNPMLGLPRLPPRHRLSGNHRDAGPRRLRSRRRGAKKKIKAKPEVMIPLVGFKKELDLQVEIVHRVAKEVMAEKKVKFDYRSAP